MTNIITPIGYNSPMTYHTLHLMHDEENIKHLGNKVLVLDRANNWAIGYTIKSYDGYTPDLLENKTYTDIRNINFGNWDAVYDFLYGVPTNLPDFEKTLRVVR